MKKLLGLIWKLKYLILGVLIFCAFDIMLTCAAPVENSTRFEKNDYERTVISHGGSTVYAKAMCGSSTAVNGYIESMSSAGYVNCGIVYGTACDLIDMLEGGYLTVTEDLALNMEYQFFYDDMTKNPTYPWYRGALEPYVYFQRDRIRPLFEQGLKNVLAGESFITGDAPELSSKYIVSGSLSDDELYASVERHRQLYWGLGMEYYEKNLKAIGEVAQWCQDNGVSFHPYWNPWNPKVPIPDNARAVMDAVEDVLAQYGVEVMDYTALLPPECFYDMGHLNQNDGAVRFTEVLDKWLG